MRTSLSLVPLLLGIVSACSNADRAAGPNAQRVALAFSTSARNSPSVVHATQASPFTQMTGANTLIITKAQVVLKRIELTTNDATNCTADTGSAVSPDHMGGDPMDSSHSGMGGGGSHTDSECEELRADPAIVDLPVDASVTSSLVATVPAGTYRAFEARIHAVRDSSPASKAFLAANPTFAGVAVHVEGTYNGTPFTYNGKTSAEIELAFDPPAVVSSTGLSITVNVDLGTWFVDSAGELLDPATAADGGENAALVSHNIHESFEAFEDENHDGHDDHKP